MNNTSMLTFHGTVATLAEASSRLKLPGDAVLVERGRPRLLLLSCPCGCGEHLPINLDSRAGRAWRLYRKNKILTLFPSVWRESGCYSHFVILRNRILLFGQNEEQFDDSSLLDESMPDTKTVLEQLSTTKLISFSDIADALDAIPWDVLKVCRQLVRSGLAREGRGNERGCFARL